MRIDPRSYDVAGLPTIYLLDGELQVLLSLMESVQPRVVIEFGVNEGRNPAAALRNIHSIERYVGVDVLPGYRTQLRTQRDEVPERAGHLAKEDRRFELILKQRGTYDLTPADLPQADFVFIDGDHSLAGVLNDYALARKILKPRGIICCHDDNCLPTVQVTQALNQLCAAGAQFVHVERTWLSYEMV